MLLATLINILALFFYSTASQLALYVSTMDIYENFQRKLKLKLT